MIKQYKIIKTIEANKLPVFIIKSGNTSKKALNNTKKGCVDCFSTKEYAI
jgi:hypothetical protein